MNKDVNGTPINRGDFVVLSEAMQLDDPKNNYGIGVGQIEHIFIDGPKKRIYVRFKNTVKVANIGCALRKLELSELYNEC